MEEAAPRRARHARATGAAFQPLVGMWATMLAPTRPPPKPVVLPLPRPPMPPSSTADTDAALDALAGAAPAWTARPLRERAALLRATIVTASKVSRSAAEATTVAKGSYGTGCGEEWMGWMAVIWALRVYADALEGLAAGYWVKGFPPSALRDRPTGDPAAPTQTVATVFPCALEAVLFGGLTGEVWLQPGAAATQGSVLKHAAPGVTLVLGAGNQLPAVAMDVLHALVATGRVVLLKMNPVNDYLGPFIERAFAPLRDCGLLRVAYGGADVGARLAADPRVGAVHLTGAVTTYNALVWGTPAPPPRGSGVRPVLNKPVTGELGCVTPVIIVPGPWTRADAAYVAAELVAGLVHNAGHNCVKAEVVVTDGEWAGRDAFLAALRAELDATQRRVAYYPGSADRAAAFEAASKIPVEKRGVPLPGRPAAGADLPWMLRTGVPADEAAVTDETWCGALQEVPLTGCGGDAAAFLKAATAFANDRCAGTLSCVVFAHPSTPAAALEGAIASLRYGCVCVNVSNVLAFSVPALSWGAWLPGGDPHAIGTGNVAVHNAFLFDAVQKSVLRAGWRYRPAHMWSPRNRNLEAACRAAVDFFAEPSVAGLVRVSMAALRG